MSTSADTVGDGWDRIAPGYDRHTTPMNLSLGEEAIRRLALPAGVRFLDIAAGTGSLTLAAARAGARVLAVDRSPAMLQHLEARARREGLAGIETRVMDGCALALDDDLFDATGSQHGVSIFPDLRAGLREMVRVTRPGGRAAVVAFGPLDRAEWLGFFTGAVRAVAPEGGRLPTDPPPPPFQVAERGKLRREMLDAGLSAAEVEAFTWRMPFRDGPHLYDVVANSNPIGAGLVAELTERQRADVRRVLDGMLRERSDGGPGAVLTCEINLGVGTK